MKCPNCHREIIDSAIICPYCNTQFVFSAPVNFNPPPIETNEEDTYKIRELSNGEKYEILKNYYTAYELETIFKKHTDDLQIKMGSCFWWIWYTVK